MPVPRTVQSGRDFAYRFSPFPSWADEDPAIQICFRAADLDLDHRVSPLRGGPVMTEKNQAIMLPEFFTPDSTVFQARA
jgi:hypothetical protein